MEKQADAYFTLHGNPFGTAGATGGTDEREQSAATRMVRNQILIRGVPVVARSLTAAGTAAMAAGISIRSKPVKSKRFLAVTARDRKSVLKHQHGRNYKAAFRAERKSTVHYKSYLGSPQVDVQEARAKRKQRAGRNLRATTLQGAGTTLIIAGRLVPTVAAGTVAMSYIDLDAKRGESVVKTDRLRTDVGYLEQRQKSMARQALQYGTATYAIGSSLLEVIL